MHGIQQRGAYGTFKRASRQNGLVLRLGKSHALDSKLIVRSCIIKFLNRLCDRDPLGADGNQGLLLVLEKLLYGLEGVSSLTDNL